MSIVQEKVILPAGQSFRLLRWRQNLRDVEVLVAPNRRQRLVGEGQHWHFHEACELICFESGTGTSFIGDRIQPLSAGDVVLLGSNLPHYWHMRGPSSGWVVQWHWSPSAHFWAIPESADLERLHKEAVRGIQYSGRTAPRIAAQLAQLTGTRGIERLAIFLRALGLADRLDAEGHVHDGMKIVWSGRSSFFIDCATQHNDPVGRRHIYGRSRKAVFERRGEDEVVMTYGEVEPAYALELVRWLGPGAEILDAEVRRFAYKVEAGAEYAITQPVFDPAALERLLYDNAARLLQIPD